MDISLLGRLLALRNYASMGHISYEPYNAAKNEYKRFILDLKEMLTDLQSKIHPQAFDYIRGQMGIKKLSDLDLLLSLPKDDINFNKYDTLP